MTPSVARNPCTRSKSCPGVRMVGQGRAVQPDLQRLLAGHRVGRVLRCGPRMRSTGVRAVTRPTAAVPTYRRGHAGAAPVRRRRARRRPAPRGWAVGQAAAGRRGPTCSSACSPPSPTPVRGWSSARRSRCRPGWSWCGRTRPAAARCAGCGPAWTPWPRGRRRRGRRGARRRPAVLARTCRHGAAGRLTGDGVSWWTPPAGTSTCSACGARRRCVPPSPGSTGHVAAGRAGRPRGAPVPPDTVPRVPPAVDRLRHPRPTWRPRPGRRRCPPARARVARVFVHIAVRSPRPDRPPPHPPARRPRRHRHRGRAQPRPHADLESDGARPVVLDLEQASVDQVGRRRPRADAVVFAAGAGRQRDRPQGHRRPRRRRAAGRRRGGRRGAPLPAGLLLRRRRGRRRRDPRRRGRGLRRLPAGQARRRAGRAAPHRPWTPPCCAGHPHRRPGTGTCTWRRRSTGARSPGTTSRRPVQLLDTPRTASWS